MKHCNAKTEHQFYTNSQMPFKGSVKVQQQCGEQNAVKYDTQQQLKMLLNRLSLEPMLFGRGDISPTAFPSLEGQDELLDSRTDEQQLNVLSNRLSLELMLFGRGEYSPTAFLSHHGEDKLISSGVDEPQLSVLSNRLSLELMLFGRGEFSPTAFPANEGEAQQSNQLDDRSTKGTEQTARFQNLYPWLSKDWLHQCHSLDGNSMTTESQEVTYTEHLNEIRLGQNLLSLELMLFGRGDCSPTAFPNTDWDQNSLVEKHSGVQSVSDIEVTGNLQFKQGRLDMALPGSFAASFVEAKQGWTNANLEPTFS